MGELLIAIPTYNERENVEEMARELLELNIPLSFDILFIDDNSPDGTGIILKGLSERHGKIKLLQRSGKLGIGSAHLDGIRYAYKHGYDYLLTMDCDFTHSPKDINHFVQRIVEADIVVGTRFSHLDSLEEWNPYRKFMTHLGHFLTKHLLKMPFDATGAFRLYKLKVIDQKVFDKVSSKGYAFFFESLYLLYTSGYRIEEVPIKLPARTYGHSKMSTKEVLKSLFMLFKLRFRRNGKA